MAENLVMVVVDGIRYRPEDAPKKKQVQVEKAAEKPANKSRPVSNK